MVRGTLLIPVTLIVIVFRAAFRHFKFKRQFVLRKKKEKIKHRYLGSFKPNIYNQLNQSVRFVCNLKDNTTWSMVAANATGFQPNV